MEAEFVEKSLAVIRRKWNAARHPKIGRGNFNLSSPVCSSVWRPLFLSSSFCTLSLSLSSLCLSFSILYLSLFLYPLSVSILSLSLFLYPFSVSLSLSSLCLSFSILSLSLFLYPLSVCLSLSSLSVPNLYVTSKVNYCFAFNMFIKAICLIFLFNKARWLLLYLLML